MKAKIAVVLVALAITSTVYAGEICCAVAQMCCDGSGDCC
jgi:hypothetical protein